MLGYAVHAREVLELLAGSLPVVLNASAPAFPPIDVDDVATESARVGAQPRSRAGRDRRRRATDLVEQIAAVPLAAWDRPFTIGDDAHTAIWIPRHAAHEGAHHLRDIARVRDGDREEASRGQERG